MATRTDVEVEWNASPRVAEVEAPSTEINMQDIVDTLRVLEDDFRGMSEKKLINAAGKEDLGGGVKVGITVALQNLLLAFAGRTTPAETGTVTTVLPQVNANTYRFEDTAADFIAAGVQRGSLLINFADKSVADVVQVESATVLRTKLLQAGTTDTFTVGDDYKIWNIVQVNAQGGNLVAVDELQATISPILPTAFTQVILTSSSSATLQEQDDIQFASFNLGVYVDPLDPKSSPTEVYPTGTRRQPAQTMTQALSIALDRGLPNIYLGPRAFTVPIGPDFSQIRFVGESPNLSSLDIPAAATVNNCEYQDLLVTGSLDLDGIIERCVIGDLDLFSGFIYLCGLSGTLTLGNGAQANILDSFSLVAGSGTPVLDMGGSGQSLALRGYKGGVELRNKTGNDACSIDMDSGQVIVDDTCQTSTSDIILRGTAKWTNRDTYAGTNVKDELVDGEQLAIMRKIMRNRMETNPTTGEMTIYDDDGVTPLLRGNIYEDVLAAQAYRGRGMERRNRLDTI